MPRRVAIPHHFVSAAGNNARVIKGGRGWVSGIWGTNTNAAIMFVKFFDVADTPNPATDRPAYVCGLPGGGAAGAGGSMPGRFCFDNGIAIAMVAGAADGDNSPVLAGEIVFSFVIW